jgi:hypothetical protein
MQELESTKGKKVTIPKRVKRFAVAYYTKFNGWENSMRFHATPESALEDFFRMNANREGNDFNPKFYTVYELELELPIIEGVV